MLNIDLRATETIQAYENLKALGYTAKPIYIAEGNCYTGPDHYLGMLERHTNDLFEPVLEAMKAHTERYMTDFLYDYDTLKELAKAYELQKDKKLVYALGIRKDGCDSPNFTMHRTDPTDVSYSPNEYAVAYFYEFGTTIGDYYDTGYPTITLYELTKGE